MQLLPDVDDERAQRLVDSHYGLARSLASRFAGRGEPLDDLLQVANLGLLLAARRFDEDRGAFSTYAQATIVGELKRHFRDRTWAIRAPRKLQERYQRTKIALEVLPQELGRSPRVSEVARCAGLTEDEVLEVLDSTAYYRLTSLEAPAGDSNGTVADSVGTCEPELDGIVDRDLVRSLLARLAPREREIVRLRFYGNLTQHEIGRRVGVSQMQVSRLIAQSLLQLRRWSDEAEDCVPA